jgi:hypothetical protein
VRNENHEFVIYLIVYCLLSPKKFSQYNSITAENDGFLTVAGWSDTIKHKFIFIFSLYALLSASQTNSFNSTTIEL